MMTPEDIKVGLVYCKDADFCDNCPIYEKREFDIIGSALSLIAQLEETISLMKIQMRGDCGCCKHGRDGDMRRCNGCLSSREYHPLWEYEGLPEVEVYESEMPVLR